MKESNQLHAICLDTYPPITYQNKHSHQIIKLLTKINSESGEEIVAYSCDAGFHVFVFVMDSNVEMVKTKLEQKMDIMERIIPTKIGD